MQFHDLGSAHVLFLASNDLMYNFDIFLGPFPQGYIFQDFKLQKVMKMNNFVNVNSCCLQLPTTHFLK